MPEVFSQTLRFDFDPGYYPQFVSHHDIPTAIANWRWEATTDPPDWEGKSYWREPTLKFSIKEGWSWVVLNIAASHPWAGIRLDVRGGDCVYPCLLSGPVLTRGVDVEFTFTHGHEHSIVFQAEPEQKHGIIKFALTSACAAPAGRAGARRSGSARPGRARRR